ncbi:hypothetical protein [Angustibacter luteus]|uniref:DUF4175 domain-containing protein n=1 Tax=Angustibacter luteus TaxID=658456 RepID=A0ABW1JK46_9ACTN
MSPWLILLLVGVVLFVLGFTGLGHFLIWVGIIVLVVGLVMSLLSRRGGSRV